MPDTNWGAMSMAKGSVGNGSGYGSKYAKMYKEYANDIVKILETNKMTWYYVHYISNILFSV